MSEKEPNPTTSIEQLLKPETEALIATFAGLRAKFNVTSPDSLSEDDDKTAEAFEDQNDWAAQVDKLASRIDTVEAAEEANFLKTAFFVAAGFTDRAYLIEVLDWLAQDEQRVSQLGLSSLATRIKSKIQEMIDVIDSV